jgi:hypothetical protein
VFSREPGPVRAKKTRKQKALENAGDTTPHEATEARF